jgi:transcriptional regulator with XRE-family HTH domain
MKEKEGYVDYPEQQMILYVEKDDGKYGPIQTGSYISANYMDDYVLKRRNLEMELRTQLADGMISPVKYYMVLEDLSLSELAARAGIRKSRVKKHLESKKFGGASVDELSRYANVFNVPVANLLQVILVSHQGKLESNLILENKAEKISVNHTTTTNPFVVLTTIEERF